MYDPLETEISSQELIRLLTACENKGIPACVIGGWAAYYYVNEEYRKAFGKDYMGSRDIDLFFDPSKEEEFAKAVSEFGFEKNGLPFRYEKVYHREQKKFIKPDYAKPEGIYNLIYIFLDVFSNKETTKIRSWHDLAPLKLVKFYKIGKINLADIDTLIALKSHALFARDKADKENKDACDLYALLNYSKRKIAAQELLLKAIDKMLQRPDLLYMIALHVLLDPARQSIVEVSLKAGKNDLLKKGFLGMP